MVQDVSFEVHAGEILGFNGLVGSGRTETMRAIFGVDKKDSGKIWYFGKEVDWKNPKQPIADRFGLLPEDRKKQGLLLKQSIRMNTTLACLNKVTRFGVIDHRKEKSLVKEVLAGIQTKYGKMETMQIPFPEAISRRSHWQSGLQRIVNAWFLMSLPEV